MIYMEQTVNLMIDKDPKAALEFFQGAETCETSSGLVYLKLNNEENEDETVLFSKYNLKCILVLCHIFVTVIAIANEVSFNPWGYIELFILMLMYYLINCLKID